MQTARLSIAERAPNQLVCFIALRAQVYEMEKIMTEISNILEEDVGAFDRDEAADVMDLIFDLREKQTLFTPELHKSLFLGRVQQNRLAVSADRRFAAGRLSHEPSPS